jgi:hypothetical protein
MINSWEGASVRQICSDYTKVVRKPVWAALIVFLRIMLTSGAIDGDRRLPTAPKLIKWHGFRIGKDVCLRFT